MSAARTSARLLRLYPSRWRERYGEELEGLIVEASGGGHVPWRTRLDVAISGVRERKRAASLGGGSPADRLRGGALLVLCAWALFVVGGMIVGKLSEHWQDAVPAGSGGVAGTAFAVLLGCASLASALVLAGAACAVPAFVRFLRRGGWSQIRASALGSLAVTAVVVAATAGLALWAGGLDAHQREGGDAAYAIAFVAWALLVCATFAAWTALAVRIAGLVELPPAVLRLEAWLSAAVATTMAAIGAATIVWWASLADAAPGFLAGGSARGGGSTLAPQLLVAVAAMVLATLVGARGAWRAVRELPALADPAKRR